MAASLAACSSTTGPTAFLAKDQGSLYFLQWANHNAALDGTLIVSTVSSEDPTAPIDTKTDTFTGRMAGSTVSLAFATDLGWGTAWNGTLRGSSLAVTFTGASGPGSLAFTAATIDAYNSALAAARTQAATAGASQAAAKTVAEQKAILDKDVAAVNASITALRKDIDKINADIVPVQTQLTLIAGYVATAKDEKVVANHRSSKTDICAAAASASAASAAAAAASAAAGAAGDVVKGDTARIVTDSAKLNAAWGKLKGDLVLYTSYVPKDIPTQKQVSDVLGDATTASLTNAKTETDDVAKAATQASSAASDAVDAQSACAAA